MDLPPSGPGRSIDVPWGTDEEMELAIQLRDMLHQFHIVTPITDDVIGYLRDIDVTDVMEKIQQL